MADQVTAEAFADAFADEDELIVRARDEAHALGIEPVTPSSGAALGLLAAAAGARTILEIGTGTGVSGLWLLRGAPEAQLTTIDADLDVHQAARAVFAAAGHAGRRVRFITGRSADVLPRMNEDAYDLVVVDADPESVGSNADAALRIVRPGGTVAVLRVLQGGRTANPARRDRRSAAQRDLLKRVRERDDLLAGITPSLDGMLVLVRRTAD